jgi:hypothetical protein
VWWIDAEQADQFPVHYTELADRVGVANSEAGAEHNARTLLQHLRDRPRWLIILDNAENPAAVENWLPEGPGHVLITSRNPNWRDIAQPLALDVFTREDSLAYLRKRIPGIPEQQAHALSGDPGDLPLAPRPGGGRDRQRHDGGPLPPPPDGEHRADPVGGRGSGLSGVPGRHGRHRDEGPVRGPPGRGGPAAPRRLPGP